MKKFIENIKNRIQKRILVFCLTFAKRHGYYCEPKEFVREKMKLEKISWNCEFEDSHQNDLRRLMGMGDPTPFQRERNTGEFLQMISKDLLPIVEIRKENVCGIQREIFHAEIYVKKDVSINIKRRNYYGEQNN